jgi:hypothetical protein
MLLTSVARAKAYLGISDSKEDGLLGRVVASASARVEGYLRRVDSLELKERTITISATLGQRKFYLPAYPIVSVSSVKYDSTGLFTGGETTITDFQIVEDRAVVVPYGAYSVNYGVVTVAPNTVRITYTAGLAAHPVNSVWVKSADAGGTLTVGKYIQGSTSLAIGIIRARGATSITYECLSGIFQASETITEYTTYTCDPSGGVLSSATGVTATLTSRTTGSLAELHPALVEGVEMHIRYYRKNRDNFGDITVSVDNVQRMSRSDLQKDYFSLPEVRDYFSNYMNRMVD